MSAPRPSGRWIVGIALLCSASVLCVGLALVLDWLSCAQIHYLAR